MRLRLEELGNHPQRGATSRSERNAAQEIANKFQGTADSVTIQPFRSLPGQAQVYCACYIIMALAAILLSYLPLLAMGLAIAAGMSFWLERKSLPVISRILPKDKSQNVVAVKRRGERSRARIILVAHYDTARMPLVDNPPFEYWLTGLPMLLLTAIIILGTMITVPGLPLPSWLGFVALLLLLPLLAGAFLMVYQENWGTPGYQDNAPGVAVMDYCFRQLASELPGGAEVWTVATGCRTAGNAGLLSFLELYGGEIREDYLINIDLTRVGTLAYLTGEGYSKPLAADRDLVLAAAIHCRDNPLGLSAHGGKYFTTEAYPALVRGYKAISVVSLSPQEDPEPENSAEDEMSQGFAQAAAAVEADQEGEPREVCPETLLAAAELVISVAKQIWAVKQIRA